MYPTACTPEVARRIDDYIEYRMRFDEHCKLFGKADHTHEYYDGYDGSGGGGGDSDSAEVIQKSFKANEPHLDPDAPRIREDFDKTDSLAAMHPRRISDKQITHIVSNAAIAAWVRTVMKGADPSKRHRVMITHGNRKFFKKRCRQAKVDAIILERLIGHKSGNSRAGVTKLMMTYDPEEWEEMQQEFDKAIPHLTISKDAMIQAELERAKAQLKNVPRIEEIQDSQRKMLEQMQQKYDRQNEELASLKQQMDKQAEMYTHLLNMSNAARDFEVEWRENELHNPAYREARIVVEEQQKQEDREVRKLMRQEEKAVEMMLSGEDGPGEQPLY